MWGVLAFGWSVIPWTTAIRYPLCSRDIRRSPFLGHTHLWLWLFLRRFLFTAYRKVIDCQHHLPDLDVPQVELQLNWLGFMLLCFVSVLGVNFSVIRSWLLLETSHFAHLILLSGFTRGQLSSSLCLHWKCNLSRSLVVQLLNGWAMPTGSSRVICYLCLAQELLKWLSQLKPQQDNNLLGNSLTYVLLTFLDLSTKFKGLETLLWSPPSWTQPACENVTFLKLYFGTACRFMAPSSSQSTTRPGHDLSQIYLVSSLLAWDFNLSLLSKFSLLYLWPCSW